MKNKIFALMLSFLFVFLSFPVNAFGYDYIDVNNEPAFFVEFKDGEKPISGAKFEIFLVAEIDSYGNYHPLEEYASFNINEASKSQQGWRELAITLEGFVQKEGIAPYLSGTTDKDGFLDFYEEEKPPKCGLYLLVGYPHAQEGFVYTAESTMVLLPSWNSEEKVWNYDVTIKPKYSVKPETEEEIYVTRKVLKTWNDKGFEEKRPKEITVYLLCDGKVYESVTLNRKNNWRYAWENLDDDHRWTVTEKAVPGYAFSIKREGITFVITNTYEETSPEPVVPQKPAEPQLPQTGQLWWPVPALAFGGILFIALGMILKRRSQK
ncbi:MAG: Cna B-type domain-containing protein [Oscillospiraceae bacterium]|nr:Cna B-type domain-containing protein [Oscillospiraceae bacterium]